MSFQSDYSQFGHNLQNSESNWAGILPPSLSPSSPFHQTSSRGSGFALNDNFGVDDFLLPTTNMELNHLGPSIQDFKGILSNPTTAALENQNQYTYHGDQSSDLSLKKFINVSIPSYTTEIDTEGKYTSFTILVQTAFASISIKRRYKNFLALHQDLSTKVPKEILPQLPKKKRLGILDPIFVEERRTSLEKYLQDITTLRSCWSCPHLIQFLDDHPPVLFLQIQTAKLNDEVHFLRYQNESLIAQYQENTAALNSANLMISDMHKRMMEWEDFMKRGNFYQREQQNNQYLPLDQGLGPNNQINQNQNHNSRGITSYKNTIPNQYPNAPMSVMSEPILHMNRPASLSSSSSSAAQTQILSPAVSTSGVIPPSSLQTINVNIDQNMLSQNKLIKSMSFQQMQQLQQQQMQQQHQSHQSHHLQQQQLQQQHIPEELINWQHIPNDPRNLPHQNTAHISHPVDQIELSMINSTLPYINHDIISTQSQSQIQITAPSPVPSSISITDSHYIQPGRRHSFNNFPLSNTNVVELLSICGVPSYLDRFTNSILSYILPSFEQLQYRFQIEKYVAKLVRKSLGAQIHQMGIHSLRCFLPDDPISLSIYLCRGLEHSWYLRLNEKLCRMSSGVASSPHPGNQIQSPQPISSVLGGMTGIAKGLSDNSKIEFPEPSQLTPALGHVISNVSFMDEHGIHSLQCLVANMTVDIRVNIKIDLCFYAFLEEFDRLIGRDHLFKKSLSLIRNWWTIEIPNEVETVLSSHYIPNDSICIMVCAIFNRFYRRIYHPIQAFGLFVAEYASFDWQQYVLTIFGPILRSSLTEEGILQDSYSDIYSDGIITSQLVGKYQDLYNESINPTSENELESNPLISLDSIGNFEVAASNRSSEKDSLGNTTPTTISITTTTISASSIPSTISTPPNPNNANANAATSSPISTTASLPSSSQTTSTSTTTPFKSFGSGLGALFERVEEDNENELEDTPEEIPESRPIEQKIMSSDCVKIFHPFNKHFNTVPDSMTNHFVSIFVDIMKRGESKMISILHLLILLEQTPGDIVLYDQLENLTKNLFKETISRFGHGWKLDLPAALLNEIAAEAESSMEEFTNEIGRDRLASSIDNMLDLIKYSHFLSSAEVTESALKTLSKDILQERGPLPVGEIGKMLQEITGISTLSAFLKDKFGGLKKFLEIFPDDFLISTDHPFNPHVFFRTAVTSDELKLINQGIIPQHLTTKTNKRRPSRKKRLSSGSLQSSIPSELNLSTISYGSGSSARSGSSGVSRSTSPPPGQGYSPAQYFHSNSPMRPNFYPQQGRGNIYPLIRTQSSGDSDRIMIAPGLSLDYDPHQMEPNYDKHSRRNVRHVDPYNEEEELPTYNPQPNLHPRRRRTVPGSTLNLDAGIISVAPGIDGPPIAAGLSNSTINAHYNQVVMPDPRGGGGGGINYVPNVFRNR